MTATTINTTTINTTSQASYLIPFKSQSAERLENLASLLKWLNSSSVLIEIILIEQDQLPQLEVFAAEHGVNYCFDQCNSAFNKSRAFNVGAKASQTEVLILGDADMILDHDCLEKCIEVCATQAEAVNPYQHLVELTQEQAKFFIDSGDLPGCDLPKGEHSLSERQQSGEQLCFCGGVYLMRRKRYLEIGGMDERFQGWGGEDDAMSLKLQLHDVSQLIKQGGVAYHLWHTRSSARYQHSDYQNNVSLLQDYKNKLLEKVNRIKRST